MFEQISISETISKLQTDRENGLTEHEAAARLGKNGRNELKETKKKTVVESFLEQLNDPLICVLFVATGVSIMLHEVSDAIIIIAVILLNAVVGVVQEGKAQKALDALKKLTTPKAVVKRDGVRREISASDVVVGDIICLDCGRLVPADLRLIDTTNLKIEESALTGESAPVDKDASFTALGKLPLGDQKNMAYMSTNVTYGRGEGIVVAAGMDTEIGRIASMLNETPQELTPLQKRLGDLGKLLSIAAVIMCALLLGIALIQKRDIMEMLLTAISLAVAAVPEGLPAIVTIVLALGVTRMVKVNTIVRRLPSVETLGSVGVVCSDKTGTLTQNKMSVAKCYLNQRMLERSRLSVNQHREFLEGFALCNDAVISPESRIGDPTELALLDLANGYQLKRETLEENMPRVDEIAFDSKRKMMTTMHKQGSSRVSYTKGAADEVIKCCTSILVNCKELALTDTHRYQIKKAVEEMSSQALRVLAIAMKKNVSRPVESGLTFIGFVGMMDPARPEVADAVQKFKRASVTTVMITGDHIDTAFAIAKQLGIAKRMDECMVGADLDKLSDQELKMKLDTLRVFARVSPEHKVRIVKALKDSGKIAAMTGDGVNDAPSLKAADIGIAMGITGTDVAKGAADIVLTDDNFATIERAIEEGRSIYENIKKSVLFLLSSNFAEIITMFLAVLCGMPTPLKASHILWVNLITDSLPALALGVDENDKESLMRQPPRNPKDSLFANGGLACTLIYGVLISTISLVAFLQIPYTRIMDANTSFSLQNLIAVLQSEDVLNRAQTYAFTVLGVSQLFHAIGMRNVGKSVFRMNHIANRMMIIAFFGGLLLQVAVTEIPYFVEMFGTVALSLKEWIHLIILSAFPLLAHEVIVLTSADIFSFHAKEKAQTES